MLGNTMFISRCRLYTHKLNCPPYFSSTLPYFYSMSLSFVYYYLIAQCDSLIPYSSDNGLSWGINARKYEYIKISELKIK